MCSTQILEEQTNPSGPCSMNFTLVIDKGSDAHDKTVGRIKVSSVDTRQSNLRNSRDREVDDPESRNIDSASG